ncbi:MAG: zf-HC2 domain-containing protein [Steroidobacteraceae bacterium]
MYPEDFDADSHQHAAGLIPWYVNGTLAANDAATLGAHLDGCARCRGDYEAQRRLFEAMQADTTLVFAAEPSFKKLMARIGTHEDAGELAALGAAPDAAPARTPASRGRYAGVARWLAAAVVIEGLGLGFGAWAWHTHNAPPASAYVTLTSPDPSYRDSPRIRVVFRSGLSVGGLGTILHEAGAHIIDGPTDANVYTLGFSGTAVTPVVADRRVAALRANAEVLFAEPLGTGSGSTGDDSR